MILNRPDPQSIGSHFNVLQQSNRVIKKQGHEPQVVGIGKGIDVGDKYRQQKKAVDHEKLFGGQPA